MSPNITRFAGKTALVTGSTGGLGVTIAHALAAEGAHVIVTGRNTERGAAVVADIGAAGGSASFIAADLGAGESAVRALASAAGPVDILVNNAGIWSTPEPTEQISEATLLASITPTSSGRSCSPGSWRPGWRNVATARSSTSDRSPV